MKRRLIEYQLSPGNQNLVRRRLYLCTPTLWRSLRLRCTVSEGWLMYFDSYITGKRIQQLRKTKGLTQEQFAVKLNISDRYLGKIERGEGTASIDLLVEVAISLNTTLDFLILGVLDTPRERELNAQIKKQNQNIQNFKSKLNSLIDELDASASV